jgi:hypothetical protein
MRRKTTDELRVPDEVQYFDWRLSRWLTSETRDRLDAAGRGAYRELLDQCYAQGDFPDDPDWICRKCACTREQFERFWPVIERHFPAKKHDLVRRYNVFADMWRKSYFSMCKANRKNGKTGGVKSSELRKLSSHRLASAERPLEGSLGDPSSLRKEGSKEVTEVKKAAAAARPEQQIDSAEGISPPPDEIKQGIRQLAARDGDVSEIAKGVGIDADAARRILAGARQVDSGITAREVVDLCIEKIRQNGRRGNVQNMVGLLIASIPGMARSPTAEELRRRVGRESKIEQGEQ